MKPSLRTLTVPSMLGSLLLASSVAGQTQPAPTSEIKTGFRPAVASLGKSKSELEKAIGKGKKFPEPSSPGYLAFNYNVSGVTSTEVLYRKNLKSSVFVRLTFKDPNLDWMQVVKGLGFTPAKDSELKLTSALRGSHRSSVEGIGNLPKNWVLRIYTEGTSRAAYDETVAEYATKWPNMKPPEYVPRKETLVLLYDRTVNLP